MEKAILIGHLNKEIKYKWEILFGQEKLPNPEEFIMGIAKVVSKRETLT